MIVRSLVMIATPHLVPLLTCDYLAPFFWFHVCVAVEGANDVSLTYLCIRSMSPVTPMNTSRHTCDWVVFVRVCVCVCVCHPQICYQLPSLTLLNENDRLHLEREFQTKILDSFHMRNNTRYHHSFVSCNTHLCSSPPETLRRENCFFVGSRVWCRYCIVRKRSLEIRRVCL